MYRFDQQPESEGAFVLSYEDVAHLVSTVSCQELLVDLVRAIEATYSDSALQPITRTGWTKELDTLEIMGCQSSDYTCVKLISSNPSLASATIPAVTGTLVCTAVGSDQARLVCDTALLTPLRTAASTAVALRRIVPEPESIGIVGAGLEGTAHAVVLALLFDDVREVVLADVNTARAEGAARQVRRWLDSTQVPRLKDVAVSYRAADDLNAVCTCDVVVTATYGSEPLSALFGETPIRAGAVIAAVGADLEGKRELGDYVYDTARFVADDLAQCLRQGELQHAAKRLRVSHDELAVQRGHQGSLLGGRIVGVGDLLTGASSFASRPESVTVYDSTGFSGQDLALARVMINLLETTGATARPWNPPQTASLFDLLAPDRARRAGNRPR